jgi:hypothetical protein
VSAFDVLVLGDANPDLVMRGGNVHPAFGQAERLVDEAKLTIGGSDAISTATTGGTTGQATREEALALLEKGRVS